MANKTNQASLAMSYSMKGGAWAMPSQKTMANNNKNMKTFGTVKPVAKKKKFDAANYAKAKKSVFGM